MDMNQENLNNIENIRDKCQGEINNNNDDEKDVSKENNNIKIKEKNKNELQKNNDVQINITKDLIYNIEQAEPNSINNNLFYLKQDERFIVNHIELSHDNNFMIIASNNGYRIIQIKTCFLCSEICDYHVYIGNITRASIFYNSSIVFFIGAEDNKNFPSNKFIIWDDLTKSEQGIISLKGNIQNYFFNHRFLILTISNEALIFDIKTLKYIKKVNDIFTNKKQIISCNGLLSQNKEMILAKIGLNSLNVAEIFIYKCKKDNIYQNKKSIQLYFSKYISNISVDKYNGNLIVFSEFYNKIHIYGMDKENTSNFIYKLKACLFISKSQINITNYCLCKDESYFTVLENDEVIYIYKLKFITNKHQKGENICNCIGKDGINVHSGKVKDNSSWIGKLFGQNELADIYQKINIKNRFDKISLKKIVDNSSFIMSFILNDSKKELIIISNSGKIIFLDFEFFNKKNKSQSVIESLNKDWIK